MRHFRSVFLAACLLAWSVQADVKLHGLFTDNMVLQRDMPVPVWGTAGADEEVTVAFGAQKKSAKAGKDGKWLVKLDALQAGGPFEMTVTGKNTITLKDVLVGEVWVCSGQSNMEFTVNGTMNSADEKAAANYPQIRHFLVNKRVSSDPQADVPAGQQWKVCTPESVGGFTAVGYFFARDLHKTLNVPIGLIHNSWGGRPAEDFVSLKGLQANPDFAPFVARADPANMPARIEKYEADLKKHKEAVEKAKAEKKPAPRAPGDPRAQPYPSSLYNGMIVCVMPYAIRGATWYQGESNAGNGKLYQTLFPAMIKNWRDDWGQGDFPFLFVQLANFMARKVEPAESNWAELREAQTMTLSLPKTGMAVIIDIGEEKDIHPKNKQDVGKRLSLAAQSVAYGKDLVFSGPLYDTMKVDGGKVILNFKHTGGGLQAKDGKLKGFSIAGEDRKFVWADAAIEGNTVVVSSEQVKAPVAVRYAWADNPECNLYNKEGLPASPFRTDNWPRAGATK